MDGVEGALLLEELELGEGRLGELWELDELLLGEGRLGELWELEELLDGEGMEGALLEELLCCCGLWHAARAPTSNRGSSPLPGRIWTL